MKKLLLVPLLFSIFFSITAFAAPLYVYQKTIIPELDSTYTLGTTSKAWLNVYTDELCLSGDCKTAWPTGGGGGGGFSNWLFDGTRLTPSTTPVGISVTGSSTIGNGTGLGGLTISGGATTTQNAYFESNVCIGTNDCAGAELTISSAASFQAPISNATIHVVGTNNQPVRAVFDTNNASNAFGSLIQGRRSRGPAASPSAVTGGDVLLQMGGAGYGTTGYVSSNGSKGIIAIKADGTWTDTNSPSRLEFYTVPGASVNNALRFTMASSGALGIGGTASQVISDADFGDSGEGLLSQGASAAPAWVNVWTEAENTAAAYLSSVDISANTNLSADGTEIILTGDALSLGTALTFTSATTTNLAVSGTLGLFGASSVSTANALCIQLTGSSALCDGSDDGAGGGESSDWQLGGTGYITPTTTVGISVGASSTIGGGTGSSGLTISGSGTTTGAHFFGDFLNLIETSAPSTPGSNNLRLWTEDAFGKERVFVKGSDGNAFALFRDNVFICRNASGSDITKGQVVYVDGQVGNSRPSCALADSDSESTMPAAGIAAENIASNADGYIMTMGILSGIDTSVATAGSRLFVSQTAGAFTSTRPSMPAFTQGVGTVLTQHASNGNMQVNIPNVQRFGLLTSGSVPFGNSSGVLTQDNTNFVFDDTTDTLFAKYANATSATSTNLSVPSSINLFGGGAKTTANSLCIQLTGSSALCDGSDDGGAGGGGSNWLFDGTRLTPSTTPVGIAVTGSSTIGGGTGATGLTVNGNSTTTGDIIVQGLNINMGTTSLLQNITLADSLPGMVLYDTAALSRGTIQLETDGDLFIGTSGTNDDIYLDTSGTGGSIQFATDGFVISDDSTSNTILSMDDTLSEFNSNAMNTDFAISSDNVSRLFWLDAGLNMIGIGSTTPSRRLTLAGGDLWVGGNIFATGTATSTNLSVTTGVDLFGSGIKTTNNALCIQLTGSADLCDGNDGGGGGSSKWTDGTNFTYLTQTSYDLALGSSATATAPFWWDVSATTSYIGNGGAGDSVITFGPSGTEWTLGFDDTDDSFRISSSTSLGTFDFIKLTSTTSLTYNATSSTSIVRGAQFVLNGLPAFMSDSGATVESFTNGMEGSSFMYFNCDASTMNAAATAETIGHRCGDFGYYEDATGGTSALATVAFGNLNLSVVSLSDATANSGAGFFVESNVGLVNTLASTTPRLAGLIRVNSGASSTIWAGFSSITPVGTLFEAHPQAFVGFMASSTHPNWTATVRTSSTASTSIDTGVPSTSPFFFDVQTDAGYAYLWFGSNTLKKRLAMPPVSIGPIADSLIAPGVMMARTLGGSTAAQVYINYLEYWKRKPFMYYNY